MWAFCTMSKELPFIRIKIKIKSCPVVHSPYPESHILWLFCCAINTDQAVTLKKVMVFDSLY